MPQYDIIEVTPVTYQTQGGAGSGNYIISHQNRFVKYFFPKIFLKKLLTFQSKCGIIRV